MAVRYYLPMFTGCVHCCCSQLTFNAFPLHWIQAAKRVVPLNEHLNGTTTATTVASQFTVKLSERETPIDTSIYRHFLLSQLLMSKAWDIYLLWFLNPLFLGHLILDTVVGNAQMKMLRKCQWWIEQTLWAVCQNGRSSWWLMNLQWPTRSLFALFLWPTSLFLSHN